MHKGNLFHLINQTLHENSSKHIGPRSNKEKLFWADVSPTLIKDLYQAYQMDFEAFEYDPVEYFSNLGLDEKTQVFKTSSA